MLTMLLIKKRNHKRKSPQHKPRGELTMRQRRHVKGEIIKDKYISKKNPLLLIGEAGSNKTKTLNRLYNKHNDLHGNTRQAIRISAYDPISSWITHKPFIKWLEKNEGDQSTQWHKLELLCDYVLETKAILYIDDLNKLTGRKMHHMRRLIDATPLWYATAGRISRIPPALRLAVDTSRVQTISLSTKNSYDATKALTFTALVFLAMAGQWQAAIFLGLIAQLAGGRNAIRQD